MIASATDDGAMFGTGTFGNKKRWVAAFLVAKTLVARAEMLSASCMATLRDAAPGRARGV